MNRITLARVLAVAATLQAALAIIVGGAMKPGYSQVSNFISELTASGTPAAESIGLYGFLPIAVLLTAFLVCAAPLAEVRGASRVGYWLLLTQAVAYVGAALAPCDAGCPAEGSATQGLHNFISVMTYYGAAAGLLLLSRAPALSRLARAGFVVAGIAWIVMFMVMLAPALAPWRGLLQRGVEVVLWSVVLFIAWRMLAPRRDMAAAKPQPA